MNGKLYYRGMIGILSINLFMGCSKVSSEPKMREVKNLIQKEKLEESKQNKAVLSISSKDKYVEEEAIRFKVDTGEAKGYLYVLYLDKEGDTEVLYPKKDTKLEKKGGNLAFPKDFNNIDVHATKDCKSCEKEKTTVYVLLSDEPISEIESLDKDELLGLNSRPIKSRGVVLGNKLGSKIYMKKIEFFVE